MDRLQLCARVTKSYACAQDTIRNCALYEYTERNPCNGLNKKGKKSRDYKEIFALLIVPRLVLNIFAMNLRKTSILSSPSGTATRAHLTRDQDSGMGKTRLDNCSAEGPLRIDQMTTVAPASHESFKGDLAVIAIPPSREADVNDGPDAGDGPRAGASTSAPSPGPSDLRREEDRRATLRDWPCKFLSAETAARNGLYYFGKGDTLRCNFCRIELSQWKEGDDIVADHGRWSPSCPFLLQKSVGNVPASGRDECGAYTSVGRPAHPAFMTEAARVTSFAGWPTHMHQTPEMLADAGFYYAGCGDQTVCYYCGGGLKDWDDDDDPWEQHALWFNRCPYLRTVKGVDFIRKVNSVSTSAAAPAVHAPPATPANARVDTSLSTKPESEKTLCKICFDRTHEVCFVPCGHVVACAKCAMSLTSCPVCRSPFTSLVRLFFS